MRRYGDDISEVVPRASAPWRTTASVERIIEILGPLVVPARYERMMATAERRIGSVALLLDSVRDPYNSAALLRTCDALGVQNVHLVEREDPFLISRRVTQGAHFWLDIFRHSSASVALRALEQGGFEPIATHPEGELLPEDLPRIPRMCVILGNEHEGIREPLRAACKRCVRVPMRGFAESLNVSVCGGILLSHATQGREGDLEPQRQRLLLARGLHRTVSRADDVLRDAEVATTHTARMG